jgi:hypothetical protein
MFQFLKASKINSDINTTTNLLDEEFWNLYEEKLRGCNFQYVKHQQLVANLKDTVNRICNSKIPIITSECTWWSGDTLYYDPSKIINSKNFVAEQRASLIIMHEKQKYSRICVIIDVSNITWSQVLKIINKASFNNIIDGLRLWSTIPHSIEKIHIIKPPENFFLLHKIILPLILSKKIQKKICIS